MSTSATSFDTAIRDWLLAHDGETTRHVAAFVSNVGSVGPLRWTAVFVSIVMFARGRRRASLAIMTAPWLSLAAYAGTRRLFPRHRPPSAAALHETSSSFPSAHTTTSAAVCCALAYVLWREHLLALPAAIALAILPPVVIGLSRLMLDVHWPTDVLGGWCAGLLVAAIGAAVHRALPSTIDR